MQSVANESHDAARRDNRVIFVWLMGASVAAIAAMLPALFFLLDPARPEPLFGASEDPVPFVAGFAIANIILSGVAIAVGLRLEPSVRMGVPLLRSWLAGDGTATRQASAMAVFYAGWGCCLAAIALAGAWVFRSQLPGLPENFVFPPVWQGILMMLGAAVREEILFRLFALNLFAWMAMKLFRQQQPTPAIIWTTNLCVALLFAAMHLIPAASLLKLNAIAVGVAIVLATSAGILFGRVYWRHGLLMATWAHAVGGVLVYLGGRSLLALAP
jgi:hypothetical protein